MKTLPLLQLTFAAALIFQVQAGEDGWVDLFNGRDLSGWVERSGKAKYTIENGAIVGFSVVGSGNSFLCTTQAYKDFVLELEFKVDPLLNSGVQIRSECFDTAKTLKINGKEFKVPAGRVHGYQVEIDMNQEKKRWWSAGIYDESRRGWLYPGTLGGDKNRFTAQGGKISKPDGWNQLRIEAKGTSIKTWLNGDLRASIEDGLTPSGLIGLQVHSVGNDKTRENLRAEFRNIRLKPL
jgi:hypothetical protein